MGTFFFKKMQKNLRLALCLLVGNIILVALAASVPIYRDAVLQRVLQKELQSYLLTTGAQPGLVSFQYALSVNRDNAAAKTAELARAERVAADIPDMFGVPVLWNLSNLSVTMQEFKPELKRDNDMSDKKYFDLSAYRDMAGHYTIKHGEDTRKGIHDGAIDVLVSERTLVENKLLLGEYLTMRDFLHEGKPLRVKIAGVFEAASEEDGYWLQDPSIFRQQFILDYDMLRQLVTTTQGALRIVGTWGVVFDYTHMQAVDASHYDQAFSKVLSLQEKDKQMSGWNSNFIKTVRGYHQKAAQLNTTMWVLQVPLYLLLVVFIYMVSSRVMDLERGEIAVLKSRGAKRKQILGIYLAQSLLITALAFAAGLPLSLMVCGFIGSSNGFMQFVRRTALEVNLSFEAILCALAVCALSVLAMTVPAIAHSRTDIVEHKRRLAGKRQSPFWKKFYLDFAALAVALFGLYTYNNQLQTMAMQVDGGSQINALLFFSSSLFMLGGGLIAIRLFPLMVKLIYLVGRRFWPPALYASLLKTQRSAGEESFIMIFLIFTLALGIFNAQSAFAFNTNNDDKIIYTNGADITLMESWMQTGGSSQGGAPPTDEGTKEENNYIEPDSARFLTLDGAREVTKVYTTRTAQAGTGEARIKSVQLMGIITDEFGRTINMRDGLLPLHINNYLNAMAQNSRAVIVSKNFKDVHGMKIGDILTFSSDHSNRGVSGVICGFVDYWPSFTPVSRVLNADGVLEERQNWLVVGNLSYIQSAMGLLPYELWIKTQDGNTRFIYDYAEENDLAFSRFTDTRADLIAGKNEPMLQGINGILTIAFIITMLLCMVGFLIYWSISIRSRSLQFGIFRAMGMTSPEVMLVMLSEMLLITLSGAGLGYLVGELSAKLYVPLLQIAYSASEQVLPMVVSMPASNYIGLFAVIFAALLVCSVIIGRYIGKLKMAAVLKLGED